MTEFYCSECNSETGEDYMISGECVCEECYFEYFNDELKVNHITYEQQESRNNDV